MNSRRFTGLPQPKDHGIIAGQVRASQQKRPAHDRYGSNGTDAAKSAPLCRSAQAPKRTSGRTSSYVRLVPIATERSAANSCSSGRDADFIARPPHRTVHAAFPHTAPTSGV
jgi:hypothetical protein